MHGLNILQHNRNANSAGILPIDLEELLLGDRLRDRFQFTEQVLDVLRTEGLRLVCDRIERHLLSVGI
jgi:hypothetical protein